MGWRLISVQKYHWFSSPKKNIRPDRGHPLHHNFQFWFWQFDLMGFWGCYTQHAKTRQRPSCVVKLIKDTLDGSEIPNNHLGCIKSPKWWDKLSTSTGAGFQPHQQYDKVCHIKMCQVANWAYWIWVIVWFFVDLWICKSGQKTIRQYENKKGTI